MNTHEPSAAPVPPGLVLGVALTGHIGLNYAVRYLPAATVSALLPLEPVGAAVLAALILGELPGPMDAVGGLLALAGVAVATHGSTSKARTPKD